MKSKITSSLLHWNYFIALEKDLEKVARYIEFSKDNYKTYSIELSKLLISSTSEIDVLLKMLCGFKGNNNCDSIKKYRTFLKISYPDFINEEIRIDRYGINFKPWEIWQKSDLNPTFWNSYNNVKHHRDNYFYEANIENVITSIGALLILLIHYYKLTSGISFKDTTTLLEPSTCLMSINADYYHSILIG